MQTHLKNLPFHSVPTLGTYNDADVFPSHIFPLSESVQNTLGHSRFVLQIKAKRSNLFPPQKKSASFQLLMICKTRPENKDLYFDQYLCEKIPKSFSLSVCF